MICARNHTVTILLLQKENATREPTAHVVCGGGYSWLKWVKWWKSVEDIEQDVSSICFETIPIGQGRGSFLRGNYFSFFLFFSSLQHWALLAPSLYLHVTQEKGIIRGRDGNRRPGEMNSGAPDSLSGGMKGGKGLINVYGGSGYQNLLLFHPHTNILHFNSNLWGEIKMIPIQPSLQTPHLFLKEVLPGDIYLFFFKDKNLYSDFLTV